jgi:hypothetical protein
LNIEKGKIINAELNAPFELIVSRPNSSGAVKNGEAKVTVNPETVELKEKQCLIIDPATLSMKTINGVRIIGVQIQKS